MDIYDKSGPGPRSSPGGYGFGRMSGVQGFRRVPEVQEVFRRAGDQVVGRKSGPGGGQEAKCSESCQGAKAQEVARGQ